MDQSKTAASAPPVLYMDKLMTADVHVVSPEMTIRQAIVVLTKHKISGAPVADLNGCVISVVSEGDLLRLAASVGLETKIGWCLQKLPKADKLITLGRTSSFSDAYKIFLTRSIHRIIIVDANGKLQGIVSRSNILRVLCAAENKEGEKQGAAAPAGGGPAAATAPAATAEPPDKKEVPKAS